MKYTIHILRRARGEAKGHMVSFFYEGQPQDTVAKVLESLNRTPGLTDTEGNLQPPIEWECSCLQKKCGSCAMVINGRPCLACGALLSGAKNGEMTLEPLRKFPVVADLVSDRSILYENLKTLKLWLPADAGLADRDRELAYEGSECLMCGCCLEVCPNFYAGGNFFGMAAVPLTARLLCELKPEEAKELRKRYLDYVYEGCGKSLACRGICPKGLDTEKLLVNTNAMALWKRKRG